MTWKSYTAVSGATVLAGWLASAPPASAPSSATGRAVQPVSPRSSVASDIEQQAARLQLRATRERFYVTPHRNLFRFGPARLIFSGKSPESATAVQPVLPIPPPVVVSLSGVAENRAGESIERTAVLSTPDGVLLVREGDSVLGQYRVASIESEAVDLVKLTDGTTLRLSLSDSKSR